MKTAKIALAIFIFLIFINGVNAFEDNTTAHNMIISTAENPILNDISSDLESEINNAQNGDVILIKPGTYHFNNITLTKNITLEGSGNPEKIIFDGEKKYNLFSIRNDSTHVVFRNITFINAYTEGFGGAISIETGHVSVDNCIFINNTAGVNAGGISNYGTEEEKGYLLLENSLFIGNHGNHDGGAVTTCFAHSDIYNCVFINNSAHRDGGAIRVSVQGYGNVQDCIFMYNHADEWGGAYYSWSGESNIQRCIFMNNTAGTNGGAVMVSGNLNLENSIIVNNTGGRTGGSFYIQQPMYDAVTSIHIHDNLITNNTSPKGQEIFIKWDDVKSLYTDFNNNDWGTQDPNDPSVIDPDKVTHRSRVSSTIHSNLLETMNLGLLNRYKDTLKDYFPENFFDDEDDEVDRPNNNQNSDSNNNNNANNYNANKNSNKINTENENSKNSKASNMNNQININNTNNHIKSDANDDYNSKDNEIVGNSTSHGKNNKAYELNKKSHSVIKQGSLDIKYYVIGIIIIFILLIIGYKRGKME